MKRILSFVLMTALLISLFPTASLAASKQMNDDVPVWTEESVRQYALDYVAGTSMERLWGYFDLQIRRYLPQESYETFLIDLEFLTGDFIGLGSYRSFEEAEYQLKTHVLHLCMEKQDVEMYFTHKNKENDWEIMAVEFVPAEKQQPIGDDMLLVGTEAKEAYTETVVTIGEEPYLLEGVLTVPADTSAPVPACVLVHDFGAHDRSHTVGKTAVFEDMARLFAEMGVATIRYDKRTYTYPDAVIETVRDEVITDALHAVDLLKSDSRIDTNRIVVAGIGLGGMLAPRITSESEGAVCGSIMINTTTENVIEYLYKRSDTRSLSVEELDQVKYLVRNVEKMSEEKARALSAFGRNGYYYWEAADYNQCKIARKLTLPVCVVYSKKDELISEDDGYQAFRKDLGVNGKFITYIALRGVNHLMTGDLTVDANGQRTYEIDSHVDKHAGRLIANWILNVNK